MLDSRDPAIQLNFNKPQIKNKLNDLFDEMKGFQILDNFPKNVS